jgi:hypothetical protein
MPTLGNPPRLARRWPLTAASIVLLTLLLAISCGESEDGNPILAGSPTAGDISPADLRQELEEMSAAWAGNSAKVTYDFTSSTRFNITETGSITVYWGPHDWRMDISGFSISQPLGEEDCDCHLSRSELEETTLIVTADNTLRCTAPADGAGQCLSVDTPTLETVSLPFLEELIKPEALSKAIAEAVGDADIDHSTQQIAGEEAICFSVGGSAQEQSGKTEWCFAEDGILLRFAAAGPADVEAGAFRLEATEISRDVSDADFEPPFPVT